MQDQVTIIFVLMAVQFALYALGGLLYAVLGADDREAAAYWGAFNLLVGAAMTLACAREET